jgi:glucose/mannose-6-phosphate isomerase
MDKLIKAFTENIKTGLGIAEKSVLNSPTNDIQNILICGMGGSGIGGKLVSDWIKNEIKIPVVLSTDYSIPSFVTNNTLVIASSYSGNTEETLAAVRIAKASGAHIVGITSGGELLTFCNENNYDVIIVPGGNQPRAAIGYSLVQLFHILNSLKLISSQWKNEILTSCQLIENELAESQELGKKLASFIHNKFMVIYTESAYEGVAVRARQQFNENSKNVGWSLAIPEMNHNELVGWGGGNDALAVIFVYTDDMNPRNKKRMDLSKEIIEKKTKNVYVLKAKGDSLIQRSMYLINVFDWASYYLVELNQVDVFDIDVINHLKGELAKM